MASRAGHKDQAGLKAAPAWFDEARKARWKNSPDLRRADATASAVTAERIQFNIKGNAYRLVVAVDFAKSIVWIKWIRTRKDYDRINAAEVGYHG